MTENTTCPQKVADLSGKWDPIISGKSRLVKYYNLVRYMYFFLKFEKLLFHSARLAAESGLSWAEGRSTPHDKAMVINGNSTKGFIYPVGCLLTKRMRNSPFEGLEDFMPHIQILWILWTLTYFYSRFSFGILDAHNGTPIASFLQETQGYIL